MRKERKEEASGVKQLREREEDRERLDEKKERGNKGRRDVSTAEQRWKKERSQLISCEQMILKKGVWFMDVR